MSKDKGALIKMDNVQKLISFLERCLENDTSNNARELVVTDKKGLDKSLLQEYNIDYSSEGNSIKINLENPNIRIFKKYEDAIKHGSSKEGFNLNIALQIDFLQQTLFENIYYFERIKKILDNEKIIDFEKITTKDYFILSSTYGKIVLSYSTKPEKIDFYRTEHSIDLTRLEELLKTESFPEFYKDSIAKFLSNNPDKDLYTILSNFDFLLANAINALTLYKQNFSFAKFEKEFDENLSSNIKKLQELTSSFQSKIMAIPIQFGVYIYLLSKFSDNFVSMLLVVATIIAWSIFNCLITSKTYRNIHYLESKIKGEIALIRQKSGIEENKISESRMLLTKDIYTMKQIVYAYQFFSILFTILILIVFALDCSNPSPTFYAI